MDELTEGRQKNRQRDRAHIANRNNVPPPDRENSVSSSLNSYDQPTTSNRRRPEYGESSYSVPRTRTHNPRRQSNTRPQSSERKAGFNQHMSDDYSDEAYWYQRPHISPFYFGPGPSGAPVVPFSSQYGNQFTPMYMNDNSFGRYQSQPAYNGGGAGNREVPYHTSAYPWGPAPPPPPQTEAGGSPHPTPSQHLQPKDGLTLQYVREELELLKAKLLMEENLRKAETQQKETEARINEEIESAWKQKQENLQREKEQYEEIEALKKAEDERAKKEAEMTAQAEQDARNRLLESERQAAKAEAAAIAEVEAKVKQDIALKEERERLSAEREEFQRQKERDDERLGRMIQDLRGEIKTEILDEGRKSRLSRSSIRGGETHRMRDSSGSTRDISYNFYNKVFFRHPASLLEGGGGQLPFWPQLGLVPVISPQWSDEPPRDRMYPEMSGRRPPSVPSPPAASSHRTSQSSPDTDTHQLNLEHPTPHRQIKLPFTHHPAEDVSNITTFSPMTNNRDTWSSRESEARSLPRKQDRLHSNNNHGGQYVNSEQSLMSLSHNDPSSIKHADLVLNTKTDYRPGIKTEIETSDNRYEPGTTSENSDEDQDSDSTVKADLSWVHSKKSRLQRSRLEVHRPEFLREHGEEFLEGDGRLEMGDKTIKLCSDQLPLRESTQEELMTQQRFHSSKPNPEKYLDHDSESNKRTTSSTSPRNIEGSGHNWQSYMNPSEFSDLRRGETPRPLSPYSAGMFQDEDDPTTRNSDHEADISDHRATMPTTLMPCVVLPLHLTDPKTQSTRNHRHAAQGRERRQQ
jgi:hypothetical protein